ncbi:hypothetical protein Neut_1095 [Nitrosomonas eutropha C91]|uniref:Uncharacterized protein n=1 Tax=Nitrosomonas eutropha (strain DSM 101675 / C91 / Nm57) TaxID=335283 RepID=Q0AH32_NITEC|nr:hypothetical protein Neut_1095 [Nitrosomonas eutropha C91]
MVEPDMERVFIYGSSISRLTSTVRVERIRQSEKAGAVYLQDSHGGDAHRLSIVFDITGGQINDCTHASALLFRLGAAQSIIAGKG